MKRRSIWELIVLALVVAVTLGILVGVLFVWTIAIKPGDLATLSFVARNPKAGDKIVWKVHQRYADGTSSEWTGPAGSRGPAPVTKLLPSEP